MRVFARGSRSGTPECLAVPLSRAKLDDTPAARDLAKCHEIVPLRIACSEAFGDNLLEYAIGSSAQIYYEHKITFRPYHLQLGWVYACP
jgi:hypothetical protein